MKTGGLRVASLCAVLPFAIVAVAPLHAQEARAPAPLGSVHSKGVRVLEPDAAPVAEASSSRPDPRPTPPRIVPLAAPVVKACPRPFDHADLTVSDESSFDRALAKLLRSKRRVVVDLAHPYSMTGDVPVALSAWLAAARTAGGNVQPRNYCNGAKGLGAWFRSVFLPKPGSIYRVARGYDITLHSDLLDQVVTQVEFSPRVVTGAR